MEKKLLTGAIASAVAMTAGSPVEAQQSASARTGLDNPLDNAMCTWDDDGIWFSWRDPNEFGEGNDPNVDYPTKYGVDVEFPAWLMGACDFRGTFAEDLIKADPSPLFDDGYLIQVEYEMVDLDELDQYCYEAGPPGVNCSVHASGKQIESAANEAAWDEFEELLEECYAKVDCASYVCTDYDFICTAWDYSCDDYAYVCNSYVIESCNEYAYSCQGYGAIDVGDACYVCEGDYAQLDFGGTECTFCDIPDDAIEAYRNEGDCVWCDGDKVGEFGACYEFVGEGVLSQISWTNEPVEDGFSKVPESIDYCADYNFVCEEYGIDYCAEYLAYCTDGYDVCVDYECYAYELTDLGRPDHYSEEWEECFTWSEIAEDYIFDGDPAWKCNAGYAFHDGYALTGEGYFAEASVKEMNPGLKWPDGTPKARGTGRQNWVKAYADCSFDD